MRQRIVIGVGGAALMALGLVIGVIAGPSLQALAASKQNATAARAQATVAKGDYCALYEQTVESELNVSQSQLESANKDALQKVINQLYADGKITQAQKAKAQQELSAYAANPCAALNKLASQQGNGYRLGDGNGQGAAAVAAARTSLLNAVAEALKLTPAALQSDLGAGKTVAQLTAAQHVSKSAVDAAYLAAIQDLLKQGAAAGALSPAQSSMATTYIQQLVAQGHYPLLDKSGAEIPGLGDNQ